jgi:guanylate kinase
MTQLARRGLCLVLAAPSGAGKSSLTRALLAAEPALSLSVSVTTRPPRPGEIDGVHYHFRDQSTFDTMVAAGGFLEWARVLGRHSYGTPRAEVEAALAAGRDVAFDIDWQGHRNLRAALRGDVVGAFILPPSLAALEVRLRERGGEDGTEIARRMGLAHEEISHCGEFDHVVVNDEFEAALAELRAILHAARSSTARQTGLAAFVAGLNG